MRDLSLHVLDLMENSIRAGATVIALRIAGNRRRNVLEIGLEDNGPGLDVAPDVATDPFYTTKRGKRTGLGLSLFRAAAEEAGGSLRLARSALGGLSVGARMQADHIDRKPLGDLASTLWSVVCTNPETEIRLTVSDGNLETAMSSADTPGERGGPAAADAFVRRAHELLETLITWEAERANTGEETTRG